MRWMILVLLTGLPAAACSCYEPSVCDQLASSNVMFVGEVVEGGVDLREDPYYASGRVVRFKVVEHFRGLPAKTTTVEMDVSGTFGMCDPIPYFNGQRYLVTSHAPMNPSKRLSDGGCFAGKNIRHLERELPLVRDYHTGKRRTQLRGMVAAGEAKPLAGARVTASVGDKRYSTSTDREGRYVLSIPAEGEHTLTASLSPYTVESEVVKVVSAGGCAIQDLAMRIDNTISGQVFDRTGKPVRATRVGLIDLDRTAGAPKPWLLDAHTEQADLTYLFRNVPLGRYLVVTNPEGPSVDDDGDNTYFPWSNPRSEAQVIEITSSGTHLRAINLTAGKPVALRKVTVRVQFTDGQPMKTAAVTVTALPGEGELPWEAFQGADKNGVANVTVAANRKLRIEVKDRHGRDLGAEYVSTHEPGPKPVLAEFIIRH